MTVVKETRHIFEVKDILVIRVQCKKCSNEVTIRLISDKMLPDNCPMCNDQRWLAGSGGTGLLKALRAMLVDDPITGGKILMEIDAERPAKTLDNSALFG